MRVDDRSAGWRVDRYLAARFPSCSRNQVRDYLREGLVMREESARSTGDAPRLRPLKPSSILNPGDRLRIYVPGLAPDQPPPPLPPVLHEDDRVIVFNKPAGLLVHPAGERFVWALIGLARLAWPDVHLDLVHRLDRDTSGTIVMTKDIQANAFLKKRLHTHFQKAYQAIVRGVIPWDERLIDAPLGHAPGSAVRIRRGVVADGSPARTHVRVQARLDGLTLVYCRLLTGRTHQIRAHLEHVGHPILGDRLYGQPDEVFVHQLEHGTDAFVRERVGFPRLALHACYVAFPHPDGHDLRVRAPLPAELRAVVEGARPAWPNPS